MQTAQHNVLVFPAAQPGVNTGLTAGPATAARNVIPFRPRRGSVPLLHDGNGALKHEPVSHDFTLGDLWHAIADDRIVNHYQPQYDFVTGRTVAVEALARVIGEDGDLVYPDRFIVQAEESGMIVPLGRAVIRQACQDLARWRRQGHTLDRVAINLSAYQLKVDTLLIDYIEKMIDAHGLDFSDLEFELTERQALDGNGLDTLQTLAAAGARLALDDFGIGYSSVAYLAELDIRTVKLDRSMVSRLPEDRATAGIVRHLLAMARELDMEIVAEGIETQEQNDYLAHAGCHLGQGYLVAKPMSAAAITAIMNA